MDIFLPLELFANWVTRSVFSFAPGTLLGEAVNYFIYDTLKILILLTIITFTMAAINAAFPIEKVRNYLSKNKLHGLEYVFASLFGTVTPFCSCSSVPLFIGFVKGGIPLGVTLTFLISSPLVDSVVVAMLIALFGLKITLVYVITGITISVIAGYLLGKMKLEKYLANWVTDLKQTSLENTNMMSEKIPFLRSVSSEAFSVFKKVFPYVILGVGVASFIHGYVPVGFFEKYVEVNSVWAVPLATLIGVPLYASAAGVLPIAQALMGKGIALGTVLAFMMATVGLSIPEALLLKKIMKWQLLAIFFGVVTVSIILSGYFFNLVL
jgi:uncharacterized membrane protein YraQ (UPF0718 family)